MRKGIVFLLVVSLSAACTSKRLGVQVLKPAEVTLPRTVHKVGVIDRSFLAGATPVVYVNEQLTDRFPGLPRVGREKTVEGFFVEFSAFKRFKTVRLTSSEKRDSNSTAVPKLTDDQLRKWVTDEGLDALVSLEGYKVKISTDGNIYSSIYYDTLGVPYTVPRFQSRRAIRIIAFWRVYNLKEKSIANERTLETELIFSSNGYSPDESYRNLPEKLGSVENTSQVAGMKYAKTMLPFWQNSERMIYLGQTNAWLEAADSAELGNWASAAEQWKRLYEKSPFPIFKRQAVFNLFTAYEVLGDFDESERWAKLGQRKYKNRDFDAALLFLDKRRVENSQLDVQLDE